MNKTKPKIYLFTDASVNPQKEVGFGAYLLLKELDCFTPELEKKTKLKKFDNTSSTKLELETLLWALEEESLQNFTIVVYTDCQNIIGLPARRDGFEKKNYITSKGTLIKNHELYKAFYKKIDILDCEFIKVKGHKKSAKKNKIDEIFTTVDRASRNALRDMYL